jgi:hypothetical protein
LFQYFQIHFLQVFLLVFVFVLVIALKKEQIYLSGSKLPSRHRSEPEDLAGSVQCVDGRRPGPCRARHPRGDHVHGPNGLLHLRPGAVRDQDGRPGSVFDTVLREAGE